MIGNILTLILLSARRILTDGLALFLAVGFLTFASRSPYLFIIELPILILVLPGLVTFLRSLAEKTRITNAFYNIASAILMVIAGVNIFMGLGWFAALAIPAAFFFFRRKATYVPSYSTKSAGDSHGSARFSEYYELDSLLRLASSSEDLQGLFFGKPIDAPKLNTYPELEQEGNKTYDLLTYYTSGSLFKLFRMHPPLNHGIAQTFLDEKTNYFKVFGEIIQHSENALATKTKNTKNIQNAEFQLLIEKMGEEHILTVARNGAGKGIGSVIPNLLTYPGSVVVIDPKGENFEITAARRKAMGQEVCVLDPFGITSVDTAKLNPLEFVNPDDVYDEVTVIADSLVVTSGNEKDPHWNERAIALFRGFLYYICTQCPAEERNLTKLRSIIRLSREKLYDLFKEMASSHDTILSEFANNIMGMPENEFGSVMSTAARHTEFLTSPRIESIIKESSFDIRGLKRGNKLSIYLVLPADKLNAYSRVARLWINSCIQAMAASLKKPEVPVLFLLDEMAQLGRMEPLVKGMTLMRGYGMKLWIILQNLGQIKQLYPNEEWTNFTSNAAIQQFFGVEDLDTAQYLSDRLGQTTIEIEEESYNQGESSSEHGGSRSESYNRSFKKMARALMTPDEIIKMPDDQILLFMSGHTIKAKRLNYYSDPVFQHLLKTAPALPEPRPMELEGNTGIPFPDTQTTVNKTINTNSRDTN